MNAGLDSRSSFSLVITERANYIRKKREKRKCQTTDNDTFMVHPMPTVGHLFPFGYRRKIYRRTYCRK